MKNKKLSRWAELLLDTGKRNNLVNFHDTKLSTVEILLPDSSSLFEKIETTSFEFFDPKISLFDELEKNLDEESSEDEETSTDSENLSKAEMEKDVFPVSEIPLSDKQQYLEENKRRIRRQNQLLAYNINGNPILAVRNIEKKAKEFIEETGVNVAYLAFGFIHWDESESSRYEYCAPVLLRPVRIERTSVVDPIILSSTEDEVILNPTFAYLMDAEYSVQLPEYDGEGFSAYLTKINDIVAKLKWRVTDECKLGIFSFLKINMYRDLVDNEDKILENDNVWDLLGYPRRQEDQGYDYSSSYNEKKKTKNPLIELHNVIDADSSQIEAIEMAKSGKSFVLQGPPGTGKSQTITNIIAECLADGKKVLFVSEKLAALNVVYDKLKKAGLEEFCLELHSHKSNKKTVITDLCHTLRLPKSGVSSRADQEISQMERAQKQLDQYASELHKQQPIIDRSLYQLYEAYATYRNSPDIDVDIPAIKNKDLAYLTEVTELLEEYAKYYHIIGSDYRNNPWYGYDHEESSYQAKNHIKDVLCESERLLNTLLPVEEEISRKLNISSSSIGELQKNNEFFRFLSSAEFITPLNMQDPSSRMVKESVMKMKELAQTVLSLQEELFLEYEDSLLSVDSYDYHERLTKLFSGTFSRLFNQEYKSIITDLRLKRKDGKRLSYQEAVKVTEQLLSLQQAQEVFSQYEDSITGYLGRSYQSLYTDWDKALKELEIIQEFINDGQAVGYIPSLNTEEFYRLQDKLKEYTTIIDQAILQGHDAYSEIINLFDPNVFNFVTVPLANAKQKCERCLEEIDQLDNWISFRILLQQLERREVLSFVHKAIEDQIAPEEIAAAFCKHFYFLWIDSILSSSSVLRGFNRITQDKAVDTFIQKDLQQFNINKVKIRAELSALRPSTTMISQGSAVAILLREGQKKKKLKSIRSLLMETGELVQTLKPCFLMSPLSVSTFLEPNSIHFDVVIFDEASQIFPQDAIGAIYRGNQLIVVGDSKQMPPSNFFTSTVEIEDEDEETGDVTDFESILDICSTTMPQLRLRWHYRSQYEQLITFSNKNFYDNDLITFPSSKKDGTGIGVDYFHVDGVFDRKRHVNRKEAEYIVDLIYKNIDLYPNRSLGVVAFSVAQQDLIDMLLTKRRTEDKEHEFFFSSDAKEPFFIKNLETVQGDERDTIIFSVAYGRDTQGKLLHNFGPLNRVGGERRLNVAVTRAKCNVQLVSSMHHTDIDLSRTSSVGARLLKEYLDYAENGEIALERSISLNQFDQFDSEFELEVCEFLRSRGFTVDTQVGCSGYRIDLGLRRPDSSDYVLAIECDGATYHSSKNARDRDRLRQEVLEKMGWHFYRIWSTDWFRNKATEKSILLKEAYAAIKGPSNVRYKTNTFEEKTEPEKVEFEETLPEKKVEFPLYKAVDIESLSLQYMSYNFQQMILEVLKVEAPLSEEWLLKRLSFYFGREKVTSYVKDEYIRKMRGSYSNGIIRRNGFLYLKSQSTFQFRVPDSVTRDVKYISPEELAAGMYEIIKQNVTVEKTGLYHLMGELCGVKRIGNSIEEWFDQAIAQLKDQININDDMISLK